MSAADEQPESTATPTRSEDSAEGGDLGHETSRAEVGHVLEFLEDGNARQAQTAWNEAKKKLLKTDDLGGMRVLLAELSAAQVPEKTRRLHGELLYSTQQNVRFLERKAGIQPSAPLVLAARAASTPMRATTVSHELDDKEELAFKVDSLAGRSPNAGKGLKPPRVNSKPLGRRILSVCRPPAKPGTPPGWAGSSREDRFGQAAS